jgi:hypothetical protein
VHILTLQVLDDRGFVRRLVVERRDPSGDGDELGERCGRTRRPPAINS